MTRRTPTEAAEVIEALIASIDERAAAGHNDTCQSMLETAEAYPCNCGHVAILAARSLAVQAVESGYGEYDPSGITGLLLAEEASE